MRISGIEFSDNEDENIKSLINFDIERDHGWDYFWMGVDNNSNVIIDSDGQSLETIQSYFDQIIDKAKYHDKGTIPENWGEEELKHLELTLVSAKITGIWPPFENNNGGIEVSWSINDFGFGTTTLFMSKKGEMVIDAECLPYDFAKWIFRNALAYHWGDNNV